MITPPRPLEVTALSAAPHQAAAGVKDNADICLVCLDHLGDAVLQSGFAQAVRTNWPDAHLAVLCAESTAGYWRTLQFLDRVRVARPIARHEVIYAWERDRKVYDLAISARAAPDFTGTPRYIAATRAPIRVGFRQRMPVGSEDCNRAFTHLVDGPEAEPDHPAVAPALILAALSAKSTALPPPKVSFGTQARQWASRLLPDGQWFAIGLGAALPHKIWPPQLFARMVAGFSDRGWGAVLLGSPKERPLSDRFLAVHSRSVVNLVGDTSIEELAAALDRCAVYVGNDSGPKHIAAALGKPVIEVSWINCDDKILRFDRNFAAFGTRNVIIRPPRPFTPQATFAGQAVQSVPVEVVIREVEALLSRGLV
jgi:ADP-heptose:LPS heptosyltransferase